jgi:TolB-like protein
MKKRDSLKVVRRQSEVSIAEESQQFAQVSHQQREFYLAIGSVFAFVRNIFFPARSVRLLLDKL